MESFRKTIMNGTHLLYFGADWCKHSSSIKEELQRLDPDTDVHLYDVDENRAEAAICGVSTLPQIQIWENGRWAVSYYGRSECNIAVIIYKHFSDDSVNSVELIEEF